MSLAFVVCLLFSSRRVVRLLSHTLLCNSIFGQRTKAFFYNNRDQMTMFSTRGFLDGVQVC